MERLPPNAHSSPGDVTPHPRKEYQWFLYRLNNISTQNTLTRVGPNTIFSITPLPKQHTTNCWTNTTDTKLRLWKQNQKTCWNKCWCLVRNHHPHYSAKQYLAPIFRRQRQNNCIVSWPVPNHAIKENWDKKIKEPKTLYSYLRKERLGNGKANNKLWLVDMLVIFQRTYVKLLSQRAQTDILIKVIQLKGFLRELNDSAGKVFRNLSPQFTHCYHTLSGQNE